MGGEKEAGKEEKNNRRRTDKGMMGGEETGGPRYILLTSTAIMQYGLTPLVLTG